MKKKYIWAIIALVIIGGSYYWYAKTHPSTQPVQYVTAAAEKGTLTTSISGSGNIIVDQSVNIDPTITGTVANLSVGIGDTVKKGQALFTIVNDQLGISANQAAASYVQAQGSLASSKASEKQARFDLEHSTTGGSDQKKILKNKISSAQISLDAANQNVEVAKEKYQSALDDSAKRKVIAPIDGTVNAINIKNGDDLSKLSSGSSRQVPMVIGDLSTMKAQVQINEVDVPNVSLGQKATMTFNSVTGLTVTGKVEKMDSLGTVAQGVVNYNATISFDTLDPRIKPGMSVSASIITGVKQDVIIVPNSAVKTQGTDNYVEVLNSGTTPQQAAVQVGAVNNTDTEIVSGLNVGDKVVIRTINPGTATAATSNSSSSSNRPGGGLRIPGVGGGGFRGD